MFHLLWKKKYIYIYIYFKRNKTGQQAEIKNEMTTPALHPNANDLENNFLKNNSSKKTYAEVIQATTMEDSSCDEAEDDQEDHLDTERSTDQ